jgi:hypothetical protein
VFLMKANGNAALCLTTNNDENQTCKLKS